MVFDSNEAPGDALLRSEVDSRDRAGQVPAPAGSATQTTTRNRYVSRPASQPGRVRRRTRADRARPVGETEYVDEPEPDTGAKAPADKPSAAPRLLVSCA